jgi:dienelactone hydrolase
MNRFLSQALDRLAVSFAAARMPLWDGRDLRLDDAERLLQNFHPRLEKSAPAKIEFDGNVRFRFPSPRPTPYSVNNIVPGRFFRCGDRWQTKPLVLLLHGWNDSLNHHFHFPRHAQRLNAAGFNAATLQLPWQFDRRPRELGLWGNFLTADILRTAEGALQALADISAFLDWARAQGCPFVGLWGISLGGWLSGLTACADAQIDGAVLTVPLVRVDRLVNEVKFCESIRRVLADRPLNLQNLNLTAHRPMIDKSKIILIESEYDLFVPKETVEELWQSWQQPEIWRFPNGHISILYARDLPGRVVRWFAAKAAHAGK